jgi:hypothetical protein
MKSIYSTLLIRNGMAISDEDSYFISCKHMRVLMEVGYKMPNTSYIRQLAIDAMNYEIIAYTALTSPFTQLDIKYAISKGFNDIRKLCAVTNVPIPYRHLLKQWCKRVLDNCSNMDSINHLIVSYSFLTLKPRNYIIACYLNSIIKKTYTYNAHSRHICDCLVVNKYECLKENSDLIKLLINEVSVNSEYNARRCDIITFLSHLL